MLQFDILVPMQLLKEMETSAGIGVPIDPDSDQAWGNDSSSPTSCSRRTAPSRRGS